jgi:hypothetical protein
MFGRIVVAVTIIVAANIILDKYSHSKLRQKVLNS